MNAHPRSETAPLAQQTGPIPGGAASPAYTVRGLPRLAYSCSSLSLYRLHSLADRHTPLLRREPRDVKDLSQRLPDREAVVQHDTPLAPGQRNLPRSALHPCRIAPSAPDHSAGSSCPPSRTRPCTSSSPAHAPLACGSVGRRKPAGRISGTGRPQSRSGTILV